MTFDEYQSRWSGFSADQRNIVRNKAREENMNLWNTLEEYWPIDDPEVDYDE